MSIGKGTYETVSASIAGLVNSTDDKNGGITGSNRMNANREEADHPILLCNLISHKGVTGI